jgi:hypothetical protein
MQKKSLEIAATTEEIRLKEKKFKISWQIKKTARERKSTDCKSNLQRLSY